MKIKLYSSYHLLPKCEETALLNLDLPKPNEILLHSSIYSKLFGQRHGRDERGAPWKRGIVSVRFNEGAELLLLFRSIGLPGLHGQTALVHPTTFVRLQHLGNNVKISQDSIETELGPATYCIGRIRYYWSHPEDQARIAFKLGFCGVIFGVVSVIDQFSKLVKYLIYGLNN